ncbi:glycosyltransferase [Halomicronema sp. CCY15110]|uniref:glycosyltransferase n=1 Tax=Halomicronema sp. CCY15110 TaxID=2767773 RepID=UPI00194E53AE|nr:glycosyltransferase [Halomicronema sp. CCY15110]
MKIALVHDYLTQKGGAERVFELLCHHFPEADIYTSLYDPQATIELRDRIVNTTQLQRIPGAARHFRMFAPLYFPAFRLLNLESYDLILSSTTSFAKSVRKSKHAKHVCFCHNVTRFLWDTETYLQGFERYQAFHPLLEVVFRQLRQVDLKYAQEPDFYIANSSVVADRIRHHYGRPATVINYPIDESQFSFSNQKDDYYLVSSRFLSYKRIDIIIEAFNVLGWPLMIIGDGPERKRLQAMAHSNVTFLGHVHDERRRQLMGKAKMVIVAALEDYGLVPIESNISGTPVIAYGAGGVLDTQRPGVTGLFFEEQTPEALISALLEARQMKWNYEVIHDYAKERFTKRTFFKEVDIFLENSLPTMVGNELAST